MGFWFSTNDEEQGENDDGKHDDEDAYKDKVDEDEYGGRKKKF